MKFHFFAFLCSVLTPAVHSDHSHPTAWGWAHLGVTLPKALSDHTANYNKDDGLVYITGGCDDEEGNKFIGDGQVVCSSISKSFYIFDPVDEEFSDLPDLPRARYRHSSAIAGNKIWIVGGRTIPDDELIPKVDVYDIETREWTTYDTLPVSAQVSDHASFSDSSHVYVAGGYDANYTALDAVYRILVDETISSSTLKLENVASLKTARGDIIAAASADGQHAFVGGGFTPENDWCEPLSSVEQYTFGSDSWESLPDLIQERAEIVMVELDNHLYALGGERQIENICELVEEVEVSELTVGSESIEVYERTSTNNEWKILEEFSDHKFRFAAVGVEENGRIYAFGGQKSWEEKCQCFRTTKDVIVFGEGLGSAGVNLSMSVFMGLGASALGASFFM